jgi:hypothetical protein
MTIKITAIILTLLSISADLRYLLNADVLPVPYYILTLAAVAATTAIMTKKGDNNEAK